jgi:hypothetical protein
MVGDKSIMIALNKLLKLKDLDHPRIHAMYMKLVAHDKDTWGPLFMAYLTKRDPNVKAYKEPEGMFPFDREGK